jgi:hypothetical protein
LFTQRAIVFITLVGIAIALFSLRSLNHSVDVANQQAAAASTAAQAAVNANLESDRQFRLSERPWVGYTSLRNTGPIIFDKPRAAAHVNIHVTVQNGGRSPAISVISFYDLVLATSTEEAVKTINKEWCDRDTLTFFTGELSGTIMLPNIPDSYYDRVAASGPPVGKPTDGKYMIFLGACIGYRNQFGELFGSEPIWLYEGQDKARSFDIRRAKRIRGRFQIAPYNPTAGFFR